MKSIGLAAMIALLGCAGDGGASEAGLDGSVPPPEDGGRSADGAAGAPDGGVAPAADAGAHDAGTVRPRPELWFEDVTDAAGVGFDRAAAEGYGTVPDRMSGGVCVIDVDGRAPVDLFFAMRPAGDGTRSRLFVGLGLLDYADETDARGLADVGDAMGCLVFDADQDGDDDLLVTALGGLRLFHNDGGVFSDRSDRLEVDLDPRDMYMAAAAGDVDGDRDLDVLVSGFMRFDRTRHAAGARCGPVDCLASIVAFEFIPDLLLEQRADGTFHDVAAARAPDLLLGEPGLVSAIRDLSGDGQPDLFVGNDLGYTFYDRVLHREGGAFVDIGLGLGLAHNWRGYGIDTMGFASGDLDGDGRLDFVETSFETEATSVFFAQPDGTYADLSAEAGTTLRQSSFRWGAALVDLDLDGDPDLVEATGHFHSDAEIAEIGYRFGRAQQPNLLVNLGDGTLRAVAPSEDDGMHAARASRGIAITDLDEDGRPDVVLAPAVGRPALLRNVRPSAGRWLRVLLRGRPPNTDAAGARVIVRAGERAYVREQVLGEGYLGSFDRRLMIGVAEDGPVDVEVRWPSGTTTVVHGVGLDAQLTVAEP